jgi:RNA polymerase sigma-70 factor, ECF subfamily
LSRVTAIRALAYLPSPARQFGATLHSPRSMHMIEPAVASDSAPLECMPVASTSPSTSLTLIKRLRVLDPEAWQILSSLYGPLIYRWARQTGLQSQDAADVLQNVLMSVMRGIEQFSHEKPGASFRGWLWTITRNAAYALVRRRGARQEASGVEALAELPALPDRNEGAADPTDADTFTALTHRALELVRQRVDSRTWEAFWQTTMADQSADDAAADLGMTATAVRQAKFRVLCRLRDLLADQ